jgi:hypothetical protein
VASDPIFLCGAFLHYACSSARTFLKMSGWGSLLSVDARCAMQNASHAVLCGAGAAAACFRQDSVNGGRVCQRDYQGSHRYWRLQAPPLRSSSCAIQDAAPLPCFMHWKPRSVTSALCTGNPPGRRNEGYNTRRSAGGRRRSPGVWILPSSTQGVYSDCCLPPRTRMGNKQQRSCVRGRGRS